MKLYSVKWYTTATKNELKMAFARGGEKKKRKEKNEAKPP
jgi:hypothetical protein